MCGGVGDDHVAGQQLLGEQPPFSRKTLARSRSSQFKSAPGLHGLAALFCPSGNAHVPTTEEGRPAQRVRLAGCPVQVACGEPLTNDLHVRRFQDRQKGISHHEYRRLAARFGRGNKLAGDAGSDGCVPGGDRRHAARVPREGIGAEILACQGSDGSWHRTDAPRSGCRPSTRCFSCRRPASTAPSLRSSARWGSFSRRASAGTRNSARSRSSREKLSRASTAACSPLAPTRAPDGEPRAAPSRRRAARRRRLELRSAEKPPHTRRSTPRSAC